MTVAAARRDGSLAQEARILALVGAGHFFAHFYIIVLPPLFPLLHQEFGVSYAALGLIMTAMHVATGVTQVPVGILVDRFGSRRLLALGLLLMGGGMALAGIAGSYWALVGFMAVVGIGNSVFHPADYAIMAAKIDHRRLGRAFSIHTSLGHVGWALAPGIVGGLTALWSWRAALVVVGLAGLAVMAAVLHQGRSLDIDAARSDTPPSRGAAAPKSRWALLTSAPMLLFFAFMVLASMVNSGINNFSVSVLVSHYGVSLGGATGVLTAYLTASAVGILLGGVIADRVRRHELVLTAGFLFSAGLLALVASVPLPLIAIGAVFVLAGGALGSMRPSRDMMVTAIAPAGAVGTVFGFVTMGLNVGGAVAPVFFGWLIDRGSATWVFYTAAILMLLALVSAAAAKARSVPVPTRG